MKIVIPGGSGHVGQSLRTHFQAAGHEVVVISRSGPIQWDGKTLGEWTEHLSGADAVINLAGRSVNCRYNAKNLAEMMSSRVDSTRVLGQAIASLEDPPKVWLQASTATYYSHRYDAPNDDETGILGSESDQMPPKWLASVEIARAWEEALNEADTPKTRKLALRAAMVMAAVPGSVFDTFVTLTRRGLFGKLGDGRQYISWIHERDFCRAIDFLIANESISGPIILAAPNPLPQDEFARILRRELGVKIGLPAPAWLLELGTWAMGTETELVLKSRRVIPSRLLSEGFAFEYPEWDEGARELASRHGRK